MSAIPDIPRPWLASYPAGVPHEIDADAAGSIVDLFESSCARFAERPAYANFGRTLRYTQLERLSRDFAAFLLNGLELKARDRVALMMPNCLQYPVALFGALRAGLTVVNVNPLYTARELHHQLVDSGASVLVMIDNCGAVAQRALEGTQIRHVVATGIGDLLSQPRRTVFNFAARHVRKLVPDYDIRNAIRFDTVLARGRSMELPHITIAPDSPAFLQYTGGTTGVAMGAVLSHRNMMANMLQVHAWVAEAGLEEGREIAVAALPLYHVYALMTHTLMVMRIGGLNHLITDPRDMRGFVRQIRRLRFSIILGVNTLFNGLLDTPGFERVDFSRLKFCFGGGAAVQRSVDERWRAATGFPIVEGYGLTEASPVVCVNPLSAREFSGTIGLPLPSTDVCIQDEGGRILDIGRIGELCVRGPQVMKGYWNRPDTTAEAIDGGGWLHTGDMASMDARGFVRIVDRKKDLIIVSGFNVYPNEVEDALAAMPGIKEVAVVGVADPRSGERVKAFVVRSDPRLEAADVKAFARESLTGYKRPAEIEFRDSLPKSNVGKILRRELRR
ncbi:AMP-binding protein [Luteimonas sp. BDR2-5]|uniref:AMP-binding protein n=1 Tax=Proluteimonas luteida TaxID=2878685 RepID=UPI001E3368DA|nr:AMP-binding protein [Luteimonas sp. BDR2-5]MCD9029539.1 AMP-binding protein [Luteimonas sp. BDR2-5]